MTSGPRPDGPAELHARMLRQAAWHKIMHGPGTVQENICTRLVENEHWQPAAAADYAARIAAEAAAWTADAAADLFRAFRAAGDGADEFEITAQQRKVRESREAQRREDQREAAERAAREGPVVIRSGAWLSGQQFGPVAWAVPGLVPEGVIIFGGPPKGGKSWLVLAVGLSLASGALILGSLRNGPPRPVLYFALEDSDRRMKQRCAELGYDKIPALFEYAIRCAPGQVITEIRAWLEAHPGQRPLVIIDTWGKISMPALKGETTYDRDYRLGGEVKDLCDAHPGATVWINHHVRKQGAADFIDAISGTYGVAGSADTVAVLARRRGEDAGRLHVTGRDVEEDSYLLAGFPRWRLDGGTLSAAVAAAQAAQEREKLGERSAQILDLIAARGQVSTKEAADALGITGDQASVYLGRLASSERIAKLGRGLWGVLVSTVGSVGSVRNIEQSQPTQQGIQGRPPAVDWDRAYEIGDPGDAGD